MTKPRYVMNLQKMKLESHFLFQKMALNIDLSGLVVSYLDIIDYTPEEISQIISCIGCDRIDKVLIQWNKATRYETVIDDEKIIWMVNGKLHRTDGPAMELANGDKEWWLNRKLHRTDGPAVEYANGGKEWWVNGERHRTDGPAVELPHRKVWYVNGKRHRTDGPAVEWSIHSDSGKQWWINGKRHRTDGPAIERSDGEKQWWVNGKRHRTDGPAIELPQRKVWFPHRKVWYVNGKRHRTDGPAVEWSIDSNSGKEWYVNGKRHRTDGPAIEYSDGENVWYFDGEMYYVGSQFVYLYTYTYRRACANPNLRYRRQIHNQPRDEER